jgi:inner membrane protein
MESDMNRSVLIKLGVIGFLMFLLMFPLMQINGVIRERQSLRDQVLQDIARSSSYSQRVNGPLVVVPYKKTVREWKINPKTDARYQEESEITGQLYFLPERFKLNGTLQTELRSRGIYQARLYHANNKIAGHFEFPARWGIKEDFADYRFEAPILALGISDIRGIENALTLSFNSQAIKFQPGSKAELLGDGVHAQLPLQTSDSTTRAEFEFDLRLQGTGQLDITPVGRESQVMLTSDWPHPSFIGDYLPAERKIDARGFTARWQTSFFSTNLEEALSRCALQNNCTEFEGRHFGVSLVDPVDQYLKSDRAIKYALLFIALTFAGFFLFEVLKRLAVHPIQYGLVGMAMAIFYLLLLSLAEHIGFALAYVISATACVSLIGFYVAYALQSVWRGLGFGAGLAGLYGMLYMLLGAEDYALLMGAILIFVLLGAVMVLTRNVNWFGLAKTPAAS